MFDQLMEEVRVINWHHGFVGCFDAICYIHGNRESYEGTEVYRELMAFMRQGAELFKEKA